jgi:hypothetical protein
MRIAVLSDVHDVDLHGAHPVSMILVQVAASEIMLTL